MAAGTSCAVPSATITDLGPDPLHRAADRLLADLASGRPPHAADWRVVMAALRAYAIRTYPDLDPDDLVQATWMRLLVARDHRADLRPGNAWGFILATMRFAALDILRKRQRQQETDLEAAGEIASPVDDIATLLDAGATQADIVGAMRACAEGGDTLTVRVVTAWLDLAEAEGAVPTTRHVGERVGVSHTTVATCLKRFREAIADGR